MVMQAPPVYEAYEALCGRIGKQPRVVFMTPAGAVFSQEKKGRYSPQNMVFVDNSSGV